MAEFGCPSVTFRYKIWWLLTAAIKQFCSELGFHFIEAPPETRDEQGFLSERY